MLGIERGENIAEMIVRRRPVAKPPEAAQQFQLLLAEAGDIDEGLRPSQHGEQTQQQHFVERIDHLAGLAVVRQIAEMTQKTNRLSQRAAVRCRPFHRRPPKVDPEDHHRFSVSPLCHALPSPDCPEALPQAN